MISVIVLRAVVSLRKTSRVNLSSSMPLWKTLTTMLTTIRSSQNVRSRLQSVVSVVTSAVVFG